MKNFFCIALLAPAFLLANPSQDVGTKNVAVFEKLHHFAEEDQAASYAIDRLLRSFDTIATVDRNIDLARLHKALCYAAKMHQGQYRKNAEKTPYIIHPVGVCQSLIDEAKVFDEDVWIVALLHDTLEDTGATAEEIQELFGSRVLTLVQELTDVPGLHGQVRYQWQIDHAPGMPHEAKLVKLADRLYNLRDTKNSAFDPAWVTMYHHWGAKMLQALKGTNPALEQALEEVIRQEFPVMLED